MGSVLPGAGLQVGAELVQAVERVQKEGADGVDLHQRQVVQLHGEDTEETLTLQYRVNNWKEQQFRVTLERVSV